MSSFCRYRFRVQIFRRREVSLVLLYNLLIITTTFPFISVLVTNIPTYVTGVVMVNQLLWSEH